MMAAAVSSSTAMILRLNLFANVHFSIVCQLS